MNDSWNHRVSQYVERVRQASSSMDELLDETRLNTVAVKAEQVEQSQQHLAEMVERMQQLVHERDELLRASDAPPQGLTLADKLLSTRHIEDARLAKQCRLVSEAVQNTHERAMALFVCQFHLANFGSELLQLLSGTIDAGTYGQSRRNLGNGGGLFNDAA